MQYSNKTWFVLLAFLLSMLFLLTSCSFFVPPGHEEPEDEGKNIDSESPPKSEENEQEQPVSPSEDDSPASEDNTSEPEEETPDPDTLLEMQVQEYIDNMTLKQKIGQMIIVGFDGFEPSEAVKDMIKNYHVGSVILFSRNVKDSSQLVKLNNDLKELNKDNPLPLIISADQEGGRVTRLPADATKFPANLVISNRKSAQLAYDVGKVTGLEMKAYGFNLNFAPVLDIFSNPKNTVIGDRAPGTTPETVSEIGIALMEGLRDGGIIPVIKHFPGHGDTVMDSHIDLPSIDHGWDRLENFELVPFRKAIEAGADMVMVAHIVFPSIMDEKLPASLSREMITGVLRERFNFDGVIISDDMDMGAIQKHYSMEEAAVKAVLAGTDIVSVCHSHERQKKAYEAILNAVEDGTIPMERINESVRRIIKLKLKYELTDVPVNPDELYKVVGIEEHRAVADKARGRN
jgi:beta-N-acetylhexosaminidase